jgi:hypothetical protein
VRRPRSVVHLFHAKVAWLAGSKMSRILAPKSPIERHRRPMRTTRPKPGGRSVKPVCKSFSWSKWLSRAVRTSTSRDASLPSASTWRKVCVAHSLSLGPTTLRLFAGPSDDGGAAWPWAKGEVQMAEGAAWEDRPDRRGNVAVLSRHPKSADHRPDSVLVLRELMRRDRV